MVYRSLEKSTSYTETLVETSTGAVLVAHSGEVSPKPVLLTYHDLGLNYVSNFQVAHYILVFPIYLHHQPLWQAFFNFPDLRELANGFSVFHLNAPGQEDGAARLGEEYEYPSMEQLAEQVQEVLNHFNIARYIGIGVGLGANVLTRHALAYPERVDSLMLINTSTTKAGWVEWGYQKRNVSHLRTSGVTEPVLDYLLWHHLGVQYSERAHDLLQVGILILLLGSNPPFRLSGT